MRYAIFWQSLKTGYKHSGHFVFSHMGNAKDEAKALNHKHQYDGIKHWVESGNLGECKNCFEETHLKDGFCIPCYWVIERERENNNWLGFLDV